MTIYAIETKASRPLHVEDAAQFKRLLFVESVVVRRSDPDWIDDVNDCRVFVKETASIDLYVDFRPGLRAQWRPWIYGYWSATQHRLEPFEKEKGPFGIGFAIQYGREEVARRWWELVNKRFPKQAMVPELPT